MATAVKSVSAKSLCAGCNKEFTKDTLDKHAGVCGRCHTKKIENATALQTPTLMMPASVMPMTSNATQYALPGEMLKLSNMSIEESKLNQAFTLNVRLDNWYKSARNNIPKNNAAVDVVYTLVKPHISNIDKIPNHNVLNFEKMFSTIHRALID